MGQKLVRVLTKKQDILWGYHTSTGVEVCNTQAQTLAEVLQKKMEPSGQILPHGSFSLLSPVTAPCQIICQGKNYLAHIEEMGVRPEDKNFNLLFSKASSSLASAETTLLCPQRVELLDYELELGLIIKKKIAAPTEITEENWWEYVAGIIMTNDLSARDVQIPERQWFKGKSFRGFCPVGPWIYLWNERDFGEFYELQLELRVNGELRQSASTSQLLHKPGETLKETSEILDLYPGDLVLTGTPGGVAMKVEKKGKWQELLGVWKSDKEKMQRFINTQKENPRYLKNGDIITSTIRSKRGVIDLGEQRIEVKKREP